MKKINKYTKIVIIIIVLVFMFRGLIYRKLVFYNKIGKRENIRLINKDLVKIIDNRINHKILNIDEIIKITNEITSQQLSFSFNKTTSNPNEILKLKKANCIGYSSLFNTIGNYIIGKQKLTNKYEFIHLIGKIEVLNYDVHNLFDNAFFKNHDYNEIVNKKTHQKIFVDPSLYDYLRIKNVTSK